jgi:hypothetical protein
MWPATFFQDYLIRDSEFEILSQPFRVVGRLDPVDWSCGRV